MRVLIQKLMKRIPFFIKNLIKIMKYNKFLILVDCLRRWKQPFRTEWSREICKKDYNFCFKWPHAPQQNLGTQMIFTFFERHGAKYPTRTNSHSSIVRNVKPFSREYSSPWQCHLVHTKSQLTSTLCSNLTGAVGGLMQEQS